MAVLYLDLDHFKRINDSYGHAVGDEVLNVAATRLLGLMRASDTIARLGGDEFAILCPEIGSKRDAIMTAERIMTATESAIAIGSEKIRVSFSIGIALFPKDGETATQLLRTADAAMYAAKEAGRGMFRLAS